MKSLKTETMKYRRAPFTVFPDLPCLFPFPKYKPFVQINVNCTPIYRFPLYTVYFSSPTMRGKSGYDCMYRVCTDRIFSVYHDM